MGGGGGERDDREIDGRVRGTKSRTGVGRMGVEDKREVTARLMHMP